jgi:hypothetical protein
VSCQNESFRYVFDTGMSPIVAGACAVGRIGHACRMTAAMRLW